MAKLVFEYTKKGDGTYNEDRLGTKGDFAWVIDGATDVFNKAIIKSSNEVGWYVDMLSKEIWNRCDYSTSLHDLLNDSVAAIQSYIPSSLSLSNTPEYWLPSFAIALVKVDQDSLSYFILGDCTVAVSCHHCIEICTDTRIVKFSSMNREKLRALRANGASKNEITKALQETRKFANAKNGYPIGSFFGSGLDRGLHGTIGLDNSSKILLCTDGMKEYFETIPESMPRMLNTANHKNEILKIDAFYGNNAQYNAYPRPKKQDDQALLILEA